MNAGLVWAADKFELMVDLTASFSRSDTAYQIDAYATCEPTYAKNTTDRSVGITLQCATRQAGAGPGSTTRHQYIFNIPDMGISETVTVAGWAGSLNAQLVFEGVRLYAFSDYTWLLEWDQLRFYNDGVLYASYGANVIENSIFAPGGVPLLGVAPYVSTSCSADPVPLGGSSGCTTHSITISSTGEGGYRFYQDGAWQTLPQNLLEILDPELPDGCDISVDFPTISAGDSYSLTANAEYEDTCTHTALADRVCDCPDGSPGIGATYHVHKYESVFLATGSAVGGEADLTRALIRMNTSDYGAVIRAEGFPQTLQQALSRCCSQEWLDTCDAPPTCETSTLTEAEVHASLESDCRFVTNSPNDIEAPLDYVTYTPYSVSFDREEYKEYVLTIASPGACGTEGEEFSPTCCWETEQYRKENHATSSFPAVETRSESGNPDIAEYLDHEDGTVRYVNTIVNPFWSFWLYFPPNSDTDNWKLYGTKEFSNAYWVPKRVQYVDGSFIPIGDRTRQRNSIITEPLDAGQYALLLAANLSAGVFTSWVGLSRFDILDPTFSTLTLDADSEPAWTFEDCTAAFGASIVLSQIGSPTTIKARLDIGRWLDTKYMGPHLRGKIGLNWSGANVSAARVYLVNQQGERTLIATATGTVSRPQDADGFYAGSWAQNFGAGDNGVDTRSGGVSAPTLIVAELCAVFELWLGYSADALEFEFDPTLPAVDVTMNYPNFQSIGAAPTVIYETGQTMCQIYPEGPGVRFGQLNFYDAIGEAIILPPNVRPMGQVSSAIDGFCWSKAFIQGTDPSNISAEIASVFDSTEGQTLPLVANGTISFLLRPKTNQGGRVVIVNSLRECPPLNSFPWRERTSPNWEASGSYVGSVYSLIQIPRRYVNAKDPMHLYAPASLTPLTSVSAISVSGWGITEHSLALTNNETPTDIVKVSTNIFARVIRWHGYFAILNLPSPIEASFLAYDVSEAMRHARGFKKDTSLWLGFGSNRIPIAWTDAAVTLPETGEPGALDIRYAAAERSHPLYLLIELDGTIYLMKTTSEGATITTVMTIVTGLTPGDTHLGLEIGRNGIRYTYWRDGTAIKGKALDAEDNVIQSTFTAIASCDEADFEVREFFTGQGEWRIGLLYQSGGDALFVTSTNGETFS